MFSLQVMFENSEDLAKTCTLLELLERGIHAKTSLESLHWAFSDLQFSVKDFILANCGSGLVTSDQTDVLKGMVIELRALVDTIEGVIAQMPDAPAIVNDKR